MRLPRMRTLSPRARRTLVPVAAVAVAVIAAGAGSAASGHGIAESSTYRLPAGSGVHTVHPDTTAGNNFEAGTAPLTPFTLLSPDFFDGGPLPSWTEFGGPNSAGTGCSGRNLSPALRWFNAPAGTKSFALFVHDNDAPQSWGWTHWITYNIPGTVGYLPKGDDTAYTSGTTDWQANGIPQVGYGGPCPPADGETHHYLFTLYALSTPDITTAGLDYADLQNAMAPYVLGATSIVGTYSLP